MAVRSPSVLFREGRTGAGAVVTLARPAGFEPATDGLEVDPEQLAGEWRPCSDRLPVSGNVGVSMGSWLYQWLYREGAHLGSRTDLLLCYKPRPASPGPVDPIEAPLGLVESGWLLYSAAVRPWCHLPSSRRTSIALLGSVTAAKAVARVSASRRPRSASSLPEDPVCTPRYPPKIVPSVPVIAASAVDTSPAVLYLIEAKTKAAKIAVTAVIT